jgi:hypothetical protein
MEAAELGGHPMKLLRKDVLTNGVRVSTVSLDLSNTDNPYQWETMIFGGPYDQQGEQHTSAEDARSGHDLWVMVGQGLLTPEAIYEMREVTCS